MTIDECRPGMYVQFTTRFHEVAVCKVLRVESSGRVWLRTSADDPSSRGFFFERDELHRLTEYDDGKAAK